LTFVRSTSFHFEKSAIRYDRHVAVPRKSPRYPRKYFSNIFVTDVCIHEYNVRFNIQITSVRISRNVKLVAKLYQISLANRGSALERMDVVTSRRERIREGEREKSK